MQKIIVEIGRTLGKALLAGFAVELARLASMHLRKKLDSTDPASTADEAPDQLRAELQTENAQLKAELAQLKREQSAARSDV